MGENNCITTHIKFTLKRLLERDLTHAKKKLKHKNYFYEPQRNFHNANDASRRAAKFGQNVFDKLKLIYTCRVYC
jgi:hypothetical protein